jgi:hypothetical protein
MLSGIIKTEDECCSYAVRMERQQPLLDNGENKLKNGGGFQFQAFIHSFMFKYVNLALNAVRLTYVRVAVALSDEITFTLLEIQFLGRIT